MLENAITGMIEGLPNMAVALLALYWASNRIDKLLDSQSKLIDALLEMVKESRRMASTVSGSSANGTAQSIPRVTATPQT